MPDVGESRALLLTGPYGAGKSALAAEIAGQLEGRQPFAALDLDWLAWYDDGVTPGHSPAAFEMCARNLAAVVANYRDAGVRLFVLAGSILDDVSHRRLVEVMAVPVHVMRVDAPLDEIERRLAHDPTSGRADDLREAREWIASGRGLPFDHDVIVNVGELRMVAETILSRWLG